MSAVVSFVSKVVSDVADTVGDVASTVVNAADDAVQAVGKAVEKTVETAVNDPIGTIAKVAAVSTGQFELLPVISAGTTLANGGDLGDALKSGAITYAAGQVGGWAGDEVSAATNYGTELGSQQTAMLAAQDAGMGMGTALGGATGAAAGAATGAALSGGDIEKAVIGGLAGYGANLGLNAAGQVVNQAGEVIANSIDELTTPTYGDQPGDFPTTPEDLAAADIQLGGIPSASMIGDQPGDYDTTPQEVAASEETLASIPGLDATADQPGDYDTTPQEVAASEETLANMPGLDAAVTADQPGDFPQTAEELAAADEQLGALPAAEVTADQPGDYDTTPEEVATSEETLANMPGADSTTLNTKGIQDYFVNQIKNNLLRNILGGGSTGVITAGGLNALGSSGGGFGGSANLVSPIIGGGGGESAALPDPMEAFRNTSNDTNTENQPTPTTMATAEELEFDPATGLMRPKVTTPYSGLDSVNPILKAAEGGSSTPTSSVNTSGLSYGTDSKNPILTPVFSDTIFPKQVNRIIVRNPLDAFNHANGGQIEGHNPEFYSEGGASMANRYVKGQGDGTSDSVPAMLASGEFVIPADVVSGLGNGDNDAGAKVLDEFLATIRKHKRAADARQLPPDSKGPLAYLTQAQKKVRK